MAEIAGEAVTGNGNQFQMKDWCAGFYEVIMAAASVRACVTFLLAGALAALGQVPEQDSRNTNIPDMNTHFQMPVFPTREAWLEKAAFLRKQILSSAGLLPMPEKIAVHAEVSG